MAAQGDSLSGYLVAPLPLQEPGTADPGSNSERSTDSPLAASEDDGHVLPHSTDPDWVEERFRVDRKKLEAMLQAAAEGKGKSGEDFFQKRYYVQLWASQLRQDVRVLENGAFTEVLVEVRDLRDSNWIISGYGFTLPLDVEFGAFMEVHLQKVIGIFL